MRRMAILLAAVLIFMAADVYAVETDNLQKPDFNKHKEIQPCSYVSKSSLACIEATLNNDGGLDDQWSIGDLADQVRDKANEHPCWVKAQKEGLAFDTGVKVKYYEKRIRIEIVVVEGECGNGRD